MPGQERGQQHLARGGPERARWASRCAVLAPEPGSSSAPPGTLVPCFEGKFDAYGGTAPNARLEWGGKFVPFCPQMFPRPTLCWAWKHLDEQDAETLPRCPQHSHDMGNVQNEADSRGSRSAGAELACAP